MMLKFNQFTTFDMTKLLTTQDNMMYDRCNGYNCNVQILRNDVERHSFNSLNNNESNMYKARKRTNKHLTNCRDSNILFQQYSDYSQNSDGSLPNKSYNTIEDSPQESFPMKLFNILERSEISGHSSIITWLRDGCSFKIYDHQLFEEHILKKYFLQSTFEAFEQQLYVYGFNKVDGSNADSVVYCHKFFIRGRLSLCLQIRK
jgi:hypothetical protein